MTQGATNTVVRTVAGRVSGRGDDSDPLPGLVRMVRSGRDDLPAEAKRIACGGADGAWVMPDEARLYGASAGSRTYVMGARAVRRLAAQLALRQAYQHETPIAVGGDGDTGALLARMAAFVVRAADDAALCPSQASIGARKVAAVLRMDHLLRGEGWDELGPKELDALAAAGVDGADEAVIEDAFSQTRAGNADGTLRSLLELTAVAERVLRQWRDASGPARGELRERLVAAVGQARNVVRPPGGPGLVERFRRRQCEVEMVLWDGHGSTLAAMRRWVPPRADVPSMPAVMHSAEQGLRVWNALERRYARVPLGYRVARGELGECFVVSPVTLELTFEPVPGVGVGPVGS